MRSSIHEPIRLRTRREFALRLLRYLMVATGFLLVSLGMGVLGYHYIARQDWINSLLNASMILSGMGPVAKLPDTAAKVFASAYALYSGVVYLGASAVLLYPMVERLLKILHLQALNTAPARARETSAPVDEGE